MEVRRYFNLIRQRAWLVVIAVLVGGLAGFISTSRTSHFTSTATIYVGEFNIGSSSADLYAESGLNQVVATFAQMIPTSVIAQRAIEKEHLNRFAGEVAASTSATVIAGTNLIEVSVTDTQSADAIRLTNGVANSFVGQITSYQKAGSGASTTGSPGQVPYEPAYVFQPATAASQSSDGLTKKLIVGALVGLIVAILLILLLDYLDVTIKGPEELERRVGLPVLGVVPYFSASALASGSSPRQPSSGR